MSQPNDLELAKQGDATAIAALMNRHLKPKGIAVAESTLKNGCLQVILESEQALDQQVFVAWIRKSMTSLNPESIDRVRVYCRQTGADFMSWTEQFAIKTIPRQPFEQGQEETLHKSHMLSKAVGTGAKKGYSFIPPRCQSVIAVLLITGLFSGCVYQVGYPWNCEEAKLVTSTANSDYERAFNKFVYLNAKDESLNVALLSLTQAKTKETELCDNRN